MILFRLIILSIVAVIAYVIYREFSRRVKNTDKIEVAKEQLDDAQTDLTIANIERQVKVTHEHAERVILDSPNLSTEEGVAAIKTASKKKTAKKRTSKKKTTPPTN